MRSWYDTVYRRQLTLRWCHRLSVTTKMLTIAKAVLCKQDGWLAIRYDSEMLLTWREKGTLSPPPHHQTHTIWENPLVGQASPLYVLKDKCESLSPCRSLHLSIRGAELRQWDTLGFNRQEEDLWAPVNPSTCWMSAFSLYVQWLWKSRLQWTPCRVSHCPLASP